MAAKVTVKITKAKNDHLWYKDKIGQEFEVKPAEDSREPCYEMRVREGVYRIIYAEDCEKVGTDG